MGTKKEKTHTIQDKLQGIYGKINSAKCIFLFASLFGSVASNAQFNKIEHFYVSSPHAQSIYNFFKNNLELPVEWRYQDWGSFSSGGLTLGNVVIEFVDFNNSKATGFNGIALEPHQSAEEIVLLLDSDKIMHGPVQPYPLKNDDGTTEIGWSIVGLKNVFPGSVNLFICDYKNRASIAEDRKEASDSLKIIHGGKAGIISLKEIVIGCKEVSSCVNEFSKLPGIKKEESNLFSLDAGPSIRLINSNTEGIIKIIIKVQSLPLAKKYLESKKIAGSSTGNSVFIDPGRIEGLAVELVDK